jgi:hypothetical protein
VGGIAAGSLRDSVVVERKTHDERSAVGQPIPHWEISEERRSCRLEPLGARTMYVAQAAQSRDTAKATFRWPLECEPLTYRLRSLDDGRVWSVTSVNRSPDREFVEVLLAEAAKEPVAAGGA